MTRTASGAVASPARGAGIPKGEAGLHVACGHCRAIDVVQTEGYNRLELEQLAAVMTLQRSRCCDALVRTEIVGCG